MAEGEGFAEEVTPDNIDQFEPVLRMPGESEGTASNPTVTDNNSDDESEVSGVPDHLFDGEPFRVDLGRNRAPQTGGDDGIPSMVTAPSGLESFLLGPLGRRDTRQESGFSREIYIPLRARDANPDFWDWPDAYTPDDPTNPTYVERRVNLRIYPVPGGSPIVDDVRLFHYEDRREFRLNSGVLIEGSSEGDILVINRVSDEDSSLDYEAKIISSGNPRHRSLLAQCTETVPNSSKRFSYSASPVLLP